MIPPIAYTVLRLNYERQLEELQQLPERYLNQEEIVQLLLKIKELDLRFPQLERRSNRRPAIQNVADRYFDQPEVSTTAMNGVRIEGTVKFFNPNKGYGFIRREGGQDVFVHANELRKSGIMDLSPVTTGAKIEFEVSLEDKGPKAVNCKMLPMEAAPTSSAAG